MPDYSKGKIYTIRFNGDDSNIYVGSTIEPLSRRFSGHKKHYKCSLYQYIQEKYNGDWSVCYIELYEEFKCDNKEQLNRKEGEIIRQIGTINKRIEGRTQKEYIQEHKQKFEEYHKDRYQQNKEKVLQHQKQYRNENKEQIKEKDKERYIKIKKENNQQIVICECGCEITKGSLTTHKKSKKHLDLLSITKETINE